MKSKKYHTFVERSKIDIPNTHVHDCSLSWLGTGTSIKRGGVKLVLWIQIFPLSEMMRSCKGFPHVSKMPTLTYNQTNSVIIKIALILNSIHNIFNICDTEVHIISYNVKYNCWPKPLFLAQYIMTLTSTPWILRRSPILLLHKD
jgi:hypothetical protein